MQLLQAIKSFYGPRQNQTSILEIHLVNYYQPTTDEIYKQMSIDLEFRQVKESVMAFKLRMDANPFSTPQESASTHLFTMNNVTTPSRSSPRQPNSNLLGHSLVRPTPTSVRDL